MLLAAEKAGHQTKLITAGQSDVYAVLEKRLRNEHDNRMKDKSVEDRAPFDFGNYNLPKELTDESFAEREFAHGWIITFKTCELVNKDLVPLCVYTDAAHCLGDQIIILATAKDARSWMAT